MLEAEQGAIEHMNEDHREAMNLYATRLLGAEGADWRCTGCDPDGLDMQAADRLKRCGWIFRGGLSLRPELRRMLKGLAERPALQHSLIQIKPSPE